MAKYSLASRKKSSLLWALMACGMVCMTMGITAVAANDVSGTGAAQNIEELLRKLEDQVSAGHAISPAQDSGMETWKQVLPLVIGTPGSPRVRAALVEFVARMRSRAVEENAAGKLVVSGDLALFAEQANRLLENSGAEPSPPVAVASDPVPDGQTSPEAAVAEEWSESPPPATSTSGAQVSAPATVVTVTGLDPLSLDGHPPLASLTEPNDTVVAFTRSTEPAGNQFEPESSFGIDGIHVDMAASTAEAGGESTEISPDPAQRRRRPHRHPYKPWPPLTELPVMLPEPPPPRPPFVARMFNWLREPDKESSR